MSKALEYLLSRPLLCTPEAAEIAALIVSRDPDAPQPQANSQALSESRPDNSRVEAGRMAGVSVIPVRGGISRYTTMMKDLGCGGTSVDALSRSLREATADPLTRCILLDCDSPGGEANGIGELAGLIAACDAKKPVYAYAGGECCSAAYWLASACRQIACAETATMGSIGCVMGMTIANDKPGTKSYWFTSSQTPLKNADPSTDGGKSAIQARCDGFAGAFIGNVAKNRKTTPDKVMGDFGKGSVMLGHEAVAVGMADGVSDFETCLGRLSRGLDLVEKAEPEPVPDPVPDGTKPKGKSMSFLSKLFGLAEKHPEVAAALAEAETEAKAEAAFAATALAAGQAPAVVAAEVVAKLELDALAKANSTILAFLGTQAETWFDSLVQAGKNLPAFKPVAIAHYVAAAFADHTEGPLKIKTAAGTDATVTRLSAVTDLYAKAAPVVPKTVETASDVDPAKAAQLAGLTVLPDAGADTAQAASDARVKAIIDLVK